MIKNNLIQASKSPPRLNERKKRHEHQAVRMAPLAWLKLRMFLHAADVEVGGFGVSAADDLLYIEDFVPPKQFVTAVTVELDVFGACDWAAMIIVARGGATYCRLRFNIGPGGEMLLPLEVDWERFPADLLEHEGKLDQLISGWMDQYGTSVHQRPLHLALPDVTCTRSKHDHAAAGVLYDELDELHQLDVLEDDYVAWAEALEEGVIP
jgi:hypothetical protein